MAHMPVLKYNDVVSILETDGWERSRQRGSHEQYHHPHKPQVVTVACHGNNEIPGGTLRSIMRTAGLESEMKMLQNGAAFKQVIRGLKRSLA